MPFCNIITVIIPQLISITHIHISLVSVWEVNFVLFNSMLKYVINRLMHAFFHFRPVTIPRPISTLGLKSCCRYWSLGMIKDLKLKRACINLKLIHQIHFILTVDNYINFNQCQRTHVIECSTVIYSCLISINVL